MLKLFTLLKPYRMAIVIVMVLTFLQAVSQLVLPTLMAAIVDVGIVNGDIPFIMQIGGFMLLVAGVGVVFSILGAFYSAKISAGFGKIVRDRVFAHVENFSLQGFDQMGTSSLITRTTNDIMKVQQVLTMMLRVLLMAPMMFVGAVILAVMMDPMLSLLIIAPLPIIVLAVFLISKKAIPLFKSLQEKTDRLNLVLREGLTGIRVIRSFNRVNHEQDRFNDVNVDFADTAIRVNKMMVTLTPIMMYVLNFSVIAIIWFGAFRIDSGSILVGDLMAFIQYAMQIMFAFIMASVMFVAIPRAAVSANRINEVLNAVPDRQGSKEEWHTNPGKGLLEFQQVAFRYPGAEKSVIRDISFTAKPGEVTAIIGGTGAGKSALVNLIPRFYEIEEGAILLDGVDIRDIPQKNLRAQIGFVPQQSFLFKGTIAENIRYGKETATDEEVKQAADIAQATEFISRTKEGFDSKIAQQGANVSGGQRQRLAIARALVRKPGLYLFDDSFSALDVKTNAELHRALQQETAHSTVLFVTQRVETVANADQIVVLDEGRMVGIGQHEELMEHCKVYQEIVASQLAEEEPA
ncbi:ABC transporter ATP-binding protein [Shouchella shacheensis]|uniref:ABC transporter ATP-binding protein n=1 Tax=Shouchella shacheensis TaxID=1649580 RepID=UPI00073FFE61|nr:ABC transporter ATP-binding protein [Shouchella shacheensis]